MDGILESGSYVYPIGYDKVDWLVDEVLKLKQKVKFYFKNTKKDIILTREDEGDYRNNTNCQFCEKETISDKLGDHCHLTGKKEVQLLKNIILMLLRIKVISYRFFTILVTMIVIYIF